MHEKGLRPRKTQNRRDEKGLGQQDFEPYAAFDPLANKVRFFFFFFRLKTYS